jgi:hypothetical protein
MAKKPADSKTPIEIAPGVYKRLGKCTSDEIDEACELWEQRMRPTMRTSLIEDQFYESVLRKVRVSELARLDGEPLFAWAIIADEAARFHIPQEAAFEIMRRELGLRPTRTRPRSETR